MAMLSRQEAASQLVDGAIEAWFDGRHACAITLAGAAETGMPGLKDGASMFATMRGAVMGLGKCSESEAATLMNTSRNWLKHFSEDKPEQISDDYAWVYVLRAYWQFRLTYKDANPTPNMVRFNAKIDEHTRPVQEAVNGFMAWLQRMVDAISGKQPPPRV
ncbi:hypothetical protein MKK75_14830 [Methylobacterium sp. J-030]|uniref:hypothetical protein n=1 Tax=Methylobacterium sp. J-030 TaxID=2836627 RepID=UPI001FBB6A0D|nr:hypothetical protein [Methylobacterium sp. J-030]MCJ2070054.1 hypothetical protein [Methylobacterium sp. J-030]